MSSVASKHALILALGGFSIAALFVWYIKNKDKEGRKRRKSEHEANGVQLNGAVHSAKQVSAAKSKEADAGVQNETSVTEKEVEETPVVELPEPEESIGKEDEKPQVVETDERQTPQTQNVEITAAATEESNEIEIGKEAEIVEVPKENVEEVFVKKEEIKLKAAPSPLTMPSKKKVIEHEQIPEEPTPTKVLDMPLSLDISAQMSPAAFSWSEEMEKSYNEEEFQTSDIDRPQPSPSRNVHNKKAPKGRKGTRGAAKENHHPQTPHQQQQQQPLKKGQRRLTKEKSVEEPQHTKQHEQKRIPEAGDVEIVDVHNGDEEGYDKSNSPGLDSQNSEASSQDSGRATGGLASSLSPLDEGLTGADDDFLPMYEFEIPNSLVGLIIGVKGKTIKELSMRTNVRMLIRQHHATEKVKTHQICQVRGKRDEINHCLQMLRRRFPSPRFPELNLQPVVPPIMPNNNFDMLSTQPTWLTLPEEIKCEIAVSSIISPSHFFIQQPTHPSFASLRHLDMYMGSLYGEHSNLPELPIPCQNGLLCAAPVGNAWFRAVTVQYYEETDEVFVKFVDYGGYSKMARQDLRQIRTDLMSLPFQSTEVMLAHVRPVDGTNNWSEKAMQKFREVCTGRVISSKLVGYSFDTRIPMVELYVLIKENDGESYEMRFDQLLMDEGLARTADPSKMVRPAYAASLIGAVAATKRPSLASQTSQTTVVC